MKAARTARLAVAASVILGLSGPASAQTEIFGLGAEGEVELGGRIYGEKPSREREAKFEEYRDLPSGLYVGEFRLRLFKPDESYSFELGGSKWGQQDQEFSLLTGRLGLWEFGFDWDQTPHIFSTNARLLATESARGVYTLPNPRPAGNDYNAVPKLDEVSSRWDTARLLFRLTPTPDLEVKAQYTRIHKSGDRPMSVPFGFSFIEVLEPIEQTVHDVKLQVGIAKPQWQLQFGYTLSLFENDLDSLTTDNPNAAADGAFNAANGTSTPGAGRLSLPPDNMAHTFNLAGGVSLPWWRTRVTSNFSYSFQLQNAEFLPHTRNQVLVANGGPDIVLPQDSLNGNVQILLYNFNVTSRPLSPLTLSLKYRFYDYMDESDTITFPGLVETDTTLEPARRAGRWPFSKHNADIDARWRIVRPVAFTLGVGWERWNRSPHREVTKSDEFFGKAALDLTPWDWLMVKAKYTPSFRRIASYNTRAHAEHSTSEEDALNLAGQSLLLRKLDEADRDRHRIDLLAQLMPTEAFTATPTLGWRHDDYIASPLGLQEETSWSAGIDLNWMPAQRLSIYGGYVHESIFQKQRSRYRPVAGGVTFDFTDFEWISDNTDTIDTYNLGIKVALIPKVLEWSANGNYSYAVGRIESRNPVAPTSGTAAQNASATATDFPAFEDALLRVETGLKYHFLKNWTAGLGYVFESFEKHDWRTDHLDPFIPSVGLGAIWLGSDQKNYTAHIAVLSLTYHF